MFTVWGPRHCPGDRVTRRDFLHIGALGVGGLTLADILRAREATKVKVPIKSVIMICLPGGPSHIDMYDLKPGAPVGVRGEFMPIKTTIPGFDICELFPRQARIAGKLALVRTVQFVEPMQHELQECYSGFPKAARRPAFGAVVSRFRSNSDRRIPRYVSLDEESKYAADHAEVESPQYVGPAHQSFRLGGDGVANLHLGSSLTPNRLAGRKKLIDSFDSLRRDIDVGRKFEAMDAFTAQALDIVTSGRAREAFDLTCEPEKVRERYGKNAGTYPYNNDLKADNYWPGDKFLLARRMVEAGVSVVTLRVGRWDHHGNACNTGPIFAGLRAELPLLDRSLSALVSDLHDRGLDKEVAVLVWGEFGRTPVVNKNEGRDHWPDAGFALFAGGGLKTGQVVGETDSKGAYPRTRPFGAQNVLGTLYHLLGIDAQRTLPDFGGQPRKLLDDGNPIAELI